MMDWGTRDPVFSERDALLVNADAPVKKPRQSVAERAAVFGKQFAGYISLALMMASWILEGEFEQTLTGQLNYQKYFFITYCTRVGWSCVLFGWACWRACILRSDSDPYNNGRGNGAFSWQRYVLWAALLGVGIFVSTYTWYQSLSMTTFAANAAIYQTAPIFVFITSVFLLNEKVTFLKVCSVLLSVGGCAELSFESQSGGENKPIGYVWEILSVLLYALYEVFYKKYCTKKDDPFPTANSQRFFGLVGVLSLVLLWPAFFALDRTGLEKFEMPNWHQWKYIIIVSVCDTFFNLFLLVTILLTSPLFTSVGTILVIPIGCAVDYFWKDQILPSKAFWGVGMIIIGFIGMVFAEHKEHEESKEREKKINAEDYMQ